MIEIDNNLFFCKNKDTYPPFKNGLYLEEYFISKYNSECPKTKRTYIPFPWTNFQIEFWFQSRKNEMQTQLDRWIQKNQNDNGYFTVVQYDDGCLLNLPPNTIIYGCCSGNIPIPLIYEDKNDLMISKRIDKSFEQKRILCSFVGTLTHHVRNRMISVLKNNNKDFIFETDPNWSPCISLDKQKKFIEITCNSKFVLCPRGYGRNSFRFYEVLKLGSIPIYVWDDKEWLPYKDIIDYEKFCISINAKDLHILKTTLSNIDCLKYNEMISEYNKIKHLFTLDGLYDYIISQN
jgi:hypothetical protein